MNSLKYGSLVVLIMALTGCVKSVNDMGGLRTDDGGIVTSILETNYLHTDAHVIGFGFGIHASFDYASPVQEDVKFFTLHISAPRNKKLNGPLKLKVTMSPSGAGEELPAGSVTIPAEISIPAFDGPSLDFPVKFQVNKANLVPATEYAATFTISDPNQGAVSRNDKAVEVLLHDNKYHARYKVVYTVKDAANAFSIENNTKFVNLFNPSTNELVVHDFYSDAFGYANPDAIMVANRATGAATPLFYPKYILGQNGSVVAIENARTGEDYNVVFDAAAPNKFTYTANDDRSFVLKYTINLTTNVNGAPLTRAFQVEEKYTYDVPQAYY